MVSFNPKHNPARSVLLHLFQGEATGSQTVSISPSSQLEQDWKPGLPPILSMFQTDCRQPVTPHASQYIHCSLSPLNNNQCRGPECLCSSGTCSVVCSLSSYLSCKSQFKCSLFRGISLTGLPGWLSWRSICLRLRS